MNTGIRQRKTALAAAVLVLAGGTLAAGTADAAAATPSAVVPTSYHLVYSHPTSTVYTYEIVDNSGNGRGSFQWSQDPSAGIPGDAMRVTDGDGDGLGVDAILYCTPQRVVSTYGHTYPYTSAWAAGNLPERTTYQVTLILGTSTKIAASFYPTVES